MKSDSNKSDVLLAIAAETEAAAIVGALSVHKIKSLSVGGYASKLKAAAPGNTAIVVNLDDYDRAKQTLAEIRQEYSHIDWSKVEITESPENNTVMQPEKLAVAKAARSGALRGAWWIVELIGLMVCLVIWSVSQQFTPILVYILTGLAVFGLFLALMPFARQPKRAAASCST